MKSIDRFDTAVIGAFVVTLFVSSAASANSVFNRYTNRNERGHSSLRVESIRQEAGIESTRSQSIKGLADKGDVNRIDITFDAGEFTGRGHSSNNVPVDPLVKFTHVDTTNVTKFTDRTNTTFKENTQFDSNIYEHETGNRF